MARCKIYPLTIAQPRSARFDELAEIATSRKAPAIEEWESRHWISPERRQAQLGHHLDPAEYRRRRRIVLALLEELQPITADELWVQLMLDDDSVCPLREQLARLLRALRKEGAVVFGGSPGKWRLS